jgi:hypothetical protein
MTKPKPARARGVAVDRSTGEAVTLSTGNVQLRERAKPKGNTEFGPQSFGRKRVKEINLVIDFRHPDGIPEHDDDDDGFWFPVAHAMFCGRRTDAEFAAKLLAWIKNRMPWAAERAQQFVDGFRSRFNPRADHLTAASIAGYLRTTEREKRELKLSTIGIYGMTAAEYKTWLAEERKRRDRERKDRQPRSEWLKANASSINRQRPWETEGISRATYFRRVKWERETGYSSDDETGCSKYGETEYSTPIQPSLGREHLVSNAAPAPSPSTADPVAVGSPLRRKSKTTGQKPVSVDQLSLFDQLSDEAPS